jgi:hydrogenase small subunit
MLRLVALTAGSAAALGATGALTRVLAADSERAPLVWLGAGEADLNLLAQMGRQLPSFLELIALEWTPSAWDALHPAGFMAALDGLPSAPVVVLESYPTLDGAINPAHTAVQEAIEQAKAAILLGTEACYGGWRRRVEDVKALESLCRRAKTPLIKLPGMPVPVQHLVGTLAHLETAGFPRLDSLQRPELYYGAPVCTHCELRADREAGRYAAGFGDPGCLLHLGCKGPVTFNSCSRTRWNGGENWCVGAGGPCVGCSEPGYPDHAGLGLYGRVPASVLAPRSTWLRFGDLLGKVAFAAAAAGVGLHLVRRFWLDRAGRQSHPHPRREDAS